MNVEFCMEAEFCAEVEFVWKSVDFGVEGELCVKDVLCVEVVGPFGC